MLSGVEVCAEIACKASRRITGVTKIEFISMAASLANSFDRNDLRRPLRPFSAIVAVQVCLIGWTRGVECRRAFFGGHYESFTARSSCRLRNRSSNSTHHATHRLSLPESDCRDTQTAR